MPPMRLLLLPISTRRALIYCEPPAHAATQGSSGAKQSYLDWGINRASTTWADWEKQPKGWKATLTQYGNAMLRRIPFEEWGLKSIPALKAPHRQELEALLKDRDAAGRPNDKAARDSLRAAFVELRYPGLFQPLSKKSVTKTLQEISTERQGLHKRRLYWSVGLMPLSAPFTLVPIIPNIPFFYLVYRAFSHWRAIGGSQHFEFLVKNNLLNLSPSKTLDSLYTTGLLHASREEADKASEPSESQSKQVAELIQRQLENTGASAAAKTSSAGTATSSSSPSSATTGDSSSTTSSSVSSSPVLMTEEGSTQLSPTPTKPTEPEEIMLLRAWNGKLVAERLGLPGLEIEIERAVEQVERDLKKKKEGKSEVQQTAREAKEMAREKVEEKAGSS